MLFNSLEFLVFFPIVVGIFFVTPHRYRWAILLIASYFFYMSWNPMYGFLLFLSTISIYTTALLIAREPRDVLKRGYLLLALVFNLGILGIFKYFNFVAESLSDGLDLIGLTVTAPTLQLLLPIGISFYTFQALSYVIDVYRGIRPPEYHFGIFALYVSFFPQLVAGPIETSTRLLPQFYKKMLPNGRRMVEGLRIMLWGYFKKIVIADNAALIVNAVYNDSAGASGIALLIGTFFFAVQIYGDFSGYSDIARGAARIMGYELTINFKQPYFARSVSDFWRRWHISLMRWFREYIYFPLGGNRVSKMLWIRNILVIFFISGIWHGANWTFVVWGGLNGVLIVLSRMTASVREKITALLGLHLFPRIRMLLQIIITFVLVIITWVFFRAGSLGEAMTINFRIFHDVISILGARGHMFQSISLTEDLGVTLEQLFGLSLSILILISVDILLEKGVLRQHFIKLPHAIRRLGDYALVSYIIFFGNFGSQAFIYFQF